ncbi:hypothetical protein ACIA49_29140 [Kribbella sp. NPDC051587]|uniref:hypothetical protein n=1 Tax=Kribbella sp. NPDC051587 TaxID=3364119 RepID=UPI00379DB710
MSEEPVEWKVQLWLGKHLIEEHVAPAELAEQYYNVLQLRIAGLANREIRTERVIPQDT